MLSRFTLHLVFLLSASVQLVAADGPIVDLGYAQYQGATDSTANLTTFLGLRYAAPPVGDLRFQAPQAPLNVTGVQPALTNGDTCFQALAGLSFGTSNTNPFLRRDDIPESEDCLFLNVVSPSNMTGPLPVVVWIHGGGYTVGSALLFQGSDLVRESNYGVVAVVIQYRLGVFGFLAGEKIKAGGALNAGLLDQDSALRWIQKHIAKFGGDPTKVTIWGDSAGAGSVLQHLVAHDGQTEPQLFRGAITSSPYSLPQYHYNDRIPELMYSEVVAQTNCTSVIDTLACLRDADAEILEQTNLNMTASGFFGTFIFVPVVDGTFITQRPTLSLAQGRLNGKALLAVTNAFEGRIFVNSANPLNASEYARQLFPEFTTKETARTLSLYKDLGTNLDQDIAIYGEAILTCPAYYMLEAFRGRSFKGEYAVPPGNHAEDIPYYFPSGSSPVFNNTDFMKAFSHSFLSFAMFLDPNIKVEPTITPKWDKWTSNEEMVFNVTAEGLPSVVPMTTDPALLERCRFWHSVGAASGQ
ncbi:Alpha/Beta hydrolase protein [Mycena floridula]|nr:Alpha/Beta hydrolase protein [Mycena floridula]